METLNFSTAYITLEEIPDEISLAVSISGCPLACKNCHSSHTWSPHYGSPLTPDVLQTLINRHPHITCVLLYDGLHLEPALIQLLTVIRNNGLYTAFYTGLDNVSSTLLPYIDYLKTGPYIEALGGLASPTTNQRLYYLSENITYKLQQKGPP